MSVLLSANGRAVHRRRRGPPGTVDGDDRRPSALEGESPAGPSFSALGQCHTQRARWITHDAVWPSVWVAVTVTGRRWNTPFELRRVLPIELSPMFWKPPLSGSIE